MRNNITHFNNNIASQFFGYSHDNRMKSKISLGVTAVIRYALVLCLAAKTCISINSLKYSISINTNEVDPHPDLQHNAK